MDSQLPDGVLVWTVAMWLVVVLAVSWLFGALARRLLAGRVRLGVSTSMVISILASAAGLFIAGLIRPSVVPWNPLALALAFGASLLGIALYGAVASHFQRPQRASLTELLLAGESDRVEFKSTGRVNLHTGAKDERMETIVAKTLASFLNADGGTLLIGVDDAGVPLGLDADLGTMKAPDVDRYELWLRDHLTSTLGQNATAALHIEFSLIPDAGGAERDVCRTTAEPSPRPVYLRPKRGATPELWVRTGNSSRQLTVDEAAEYVMYRWPLGIGSSVAAQTKAFLRFAGER